MADTRAAEDNVVVMTTKSQRYHQNRILFIGVTVLVCLSVTVVAVVALTHHSDKKPSKQSAVAMSVCPDSLLQSAASDFSPANLEQLGSVVSEIKSVKNYQEDANCLYPIALYYINSGNGAAAENYLSELNKIYNPIKQQLSTTLYDAAGYQSIQTLQSSAAYLVKQQQQIDNTFKNQKVAIQP